ncbi:ion transporter [Streptomyces pluripotens]|uniref:Ion transporter n=1 Tax=Streptomyces pluripotens TaxID=1355015 RepID=A0A221NUH9_9ACTN|nr:MULTISPECIES: potassium channel family protein [Streptomyces]ARP69304.1 ion transporter [Streptomyces pluripotens]ASN23562.1 ion transporter [Streptomyces pluripotens]KIE28392.1 ion transporter [Streptomyces sp. MUSC 125]MCH0555257.1 ion transporter [Streptomyces sp. MUM 16J]
MDADSPEARWEQRTEIPLFLAALLFIAAYAARVLAVDMPALWQDVCGFALLALWMLFAVDYGVRWRLSGQGLRFVPAHPLHTVVVILPLLRPLRIIPLYDVMRRRHVQPRLSLHARVIAYASLSTLLLGFAGSLAVYQQERDAPGATMRTFGDAVWWACSTLSTVGYGDITPVTPLGRVIASGMMAGGLALLGAVTGSFSSWLLQVFSLEGDERPPQD